MVEEPVGGDHESSFLIELKLSPDSAIKNPNRPSGYKYKIVFKALSTMVVTLVRWTLADYHAID